MISRVSACSRSPCTPTLVPEEKHKGPKHPSQALWDGQAYLGPSPALGCPGPNAGTQGSVEVAGADLLQVSQHCCSLLVACGSACLFSRGDKK